MRKFSTYDGLYTKTPKGQLSKPVTTTTSCAPPVQDRVEERCENAQIFTPAPQLSTKAMKCYSAIKQHDDLVKSLLKHQ